MQVCGRTISGRDRFVYSLGNNQPDPEPPGPSQADPAREIRREIRWGRLRRGVGQAAVMTPPWLPKKKAATGVVRLKWV